MKISDLLIILKLLNIEYEISPYHDNEITIYTHNKQEHIESIINILKQNKFGYYISTSYDIGIF